MKYKNEFILGTTFVEKWDGKSNLIISDAILR